MSKTGYWNHRVFKQPDNLTNWWYTIRETYYNENGDVHSYSAEARGVGAESVKDMSEILDWMKNCLDKPIIELDKNGELVIKQT